MSTEKRDFDSAAASWDEKPQRVQLAGDIAGAVEAAVPIAAGMDVLDVGCGTGLLSLRWAPRVRSLTGADGSQGMLDVFAAKAARAGFPNVRTQLFDADGDGAPDGRYDLVVSSMALHHIRSVDPLLATLHRVLVPGGHLCIADLDPDDGEFHLDPQGIFHNGFERDALRDAFTAAGFAGVRVCSAAHVEKPTARGTLRRFSIFLAVGRKP